MKPTNFALRLNQCLDKEGFPPKNRGRIQLLAEMVGLTHRGASKWINGESEPPAKKIPHLANKLNVSEKWLLTGEGEMEEEEPIKTAKDKTIIINVPIYEISSITSGHKTVLKNIQCTLSSPGEYFGITLDTEAMSPRFPSGSIIIFDTTKAKDGDFVLVNYYGLPSPIFRQLFIIGDTLYLNAHNPKFDRLVLHDPKRILGKLVQAILVFD